MKAIRSLGPVAACAVILLLGSSAVAGIHSLGGRFTANRGRLAQVPLVGAAFPGCHQLTFMTGAGPAGPVTPPATMVQGINQRGAKPDLGCVPAKDGQMIATTGAGTLPVAGGAFTLPKGVFFNPGPGIINAISLTTPPGFVEFATNNIVSGPATPRDEAPGGTQLTGCVGTGAAKMCANQAPIGAFKVGPRIGATGSGRAGAAFAWCPPNPAAGTMGATGCAAIGGGPGVPAVPGIIKYFGTPGAFGGTMGYITRSLQQGSLWRFNRGGKVQRTPFPPTGANGSQPTGRGYADRNTDALLPASSFDMFMVGLVTPNPKLGPQNLVTTVTGPMLAGAPAIAHNWGFPLTTKTVVVRNTGTVGGGPHNTTLTGKGYDCVGAKGVGCAVATGMNYRNINLVAGSIGVGVFPIGGGAVLNVPTVNFSSLFIPEPGARLQLLAGAIGLLGVAAWRSRRRVR